MPTLNCPLIVAVHQIFSNKRDLSGGLAHPHEVFNADIVHSAYAFILVHNHPSGVKPYPVLRRTERGVPSGEALAGAA